MANPLRQRNPQRPLSLQSSRNQSLQQNLRSLRSLGWLRSLRQQNPRSLSPRRQPHGLITQQPQPLRAHPQHQRRSRHHPDRHHVLVPPQSDRVRPRAKTLKSCPVLGLRPVLEHQHAWEHRPKPAPPHARLHDLNSSANQSLAVQEVLELPCVPAQECPNAKGGLHVLVPLHEPGNPAHPPGPLETHSNWLVSQSGATARPELDDQDRQHDPGLPHDLACPVACANRWRPASSCSSKSPLVVRQLQHPVVPTLLIGPRKPPELPLLQWRGLQHPQHPGDQDSVPVLPVANDAQGAPIGTTVPSSRHCAAARLKNKGKKSISLARTTTLSQHKPADLPVNSRPLCCRQAWRAQPNRKLNNEQRPNLWPRCANAARKQPANGNVVAPWNCGQPVRPSRYAQR